MHTSEDEQLLQDYLNGCSESFELLVRRYSQEVFHFLYRVLGSAAAAEDILQETFLQVHLAAAKFDPQRRFRPWVFTIAANKARDMLRSQRRRPEMPLDAAVDRESGRSPTFSDLVGVVTTPPSIQLETEERSLQIKRLVDCLPDPLKEVLILGYFHGFAYKEMSQILDVPLGTIKSRLHSAVHTFAGLYRQGHARVEPSAEHILESLRVSPNAH